MADKAFRAGRTKQGDVFFIRISHWDKDDKFREITARSVGHSAIEDISPTCWTQDGFQITLWPDAQLSFTQRQALWTKLKKMLTKHEGHEIAPMIACKAAHP